MTRIRSIAAAIFLFAGIASAQEADQVALVANYQGSSSACFTAGWYSAGAVIAILVGWAIHPNPVENQLDNMANAFNGLRLTGKALAGIGILEAKEAWEQWANCLSRVIFNGPVEFIPATNSTSSN